MTNKLINPTKKVDRQSFDEFLNQVPDLAEDARDQLNDLVHACTETGKAGEFVLKIKIKPIGGKAGQIELETDVKTKTPQPTRGKTLLFATKDNNLSRQDPRQQTLDGVRTVSEESQEQKTVRSAPATASAPLRAVS